MQWFSRVGSTNNSCFLIHHSHKLEFHNIPFTLTAHQGLFVKNAALTINIVLISVCQVVRERSPRADAPSSSEGDSRNAEEQMKAWLPHQPATMYTQPGLRVWNHRQLLSNDQPSAHHPSKRAEPIISCSMPHTQCDTIPRSSRSDQ